MAAIDLEKLSLPELKSLQKDIAKAIADFGNRKKVEALSALEEHAKALGFSLAELTGMKARKARAGSGAAEVPPPGESGSDLVGSWTEARLVRGGCRGWQGSGVDGRLSSLTADTVLVSVQAVDVGSHNIDRACHIGRPVSFAPSAVDVAGNRHAVSCVIRIAVARLRK